MKAKDHLVKAANDLESRGRLRDQTDGERSMQRTVAIFKTYTGIELSESDGWKFMICLKQARSFGGRHHDDDYTDMASYAALAGEAAAKEMRGRRGIDVNELDVQTLDSAQNGGFGEHVQ